MEEEADNEELFEVQEILVDPKQSPVRIDKFVTDKLPRVSRNRVQNGIRSGSILVDGQQVKPNHKLSPGERITVIIPRHADRPEGLIPEAIPLDIRYEDDALMIVHKPPGMVVHPGVGNPSGTLVNALAHYLRHEDDIPVLPGNDDDRVGLVHRIDKDTSGLLVIAKTDEAMSHLARQFFDHSIDRTYQAIVWGSPDPADGTIDRNIGRHPRVRQNYTVFDEEEEGKKAITHYRTLEDLYYVSLCELKLETGRTHQIRVHMKSIGNPVFMDEKYGGDRIIKGTVYSKYKSFVERCMEMCPRQALHAKSIGFIHPTTREYVHFDSELPQDMHDCLERWRTYVGHRRHNNLLES
ncbi:23S rRNA pseudouridine1911/1915/1917 synthase [Lewinella marina]|uniref:Pseudouridine synthase n=1 Tax=Neolewinella marina TaxID=438751 RepID=A0A2G0CIL7_9BACT|nr:RluA family pseudouridine synthase [Neolewinella marina]NJB85028.1 23S rRNA pseudouridine1911/1915/1917 synthase [Neolewinella marina]PHK99824.1 RNA pseudouridine synthase [Neolewinella marina]